MHLHRCGKYAPCPLIHHEERAIAARTICSGEISFKGRNKSETKARKIKQYR
jgi:hypothetical protein